MRRTAVVAGCLFALTVVLYARTTAYEFVIWDDQANIYANPRMAADSPGGAAAFWREPVGGLYVPVTYTAWWLLARLAGTVTRPGVHPGPIVDPAPFHAANVLAHAAAVVLAFLLLHRLLGRRSPAGAAAGAALFALHPLQVEPVAWATGLKDVLSGALGLGALLLHLRFVELRGQGRGRAAALAWAAGFLAFAGAVLAKPQAVALPLIAALLVMLTAPGTSRRGVAGPLLPHLVLAFASMAITLGTQTEEDAVLSWTPAPLAARPLLALDALGFYAAKVLWPAPLAIDYGRTPHAVLSRFPAVPFVLIPLALAALVLRLRSDRAVHRAASGMALLAVLPVLGLVPFAFQSQSTVADRYAYLSLAGVGLSLGAWVAAGRGVGRLAVAGVVLAAFAAAGQLQMPRWRTNDSLFRHALAVNPESVSATYDLALSASYAGRYDEAIGLYTRAVEIRDDFYHAHHNLGVAHNHLGRFEEALPHFARARELRPAAPDVLLNTALALRRLARHDEAIDVLRELVKVQPDAPRPWIDLGMACLETARPEEAARAFGEAAALAPAEPMPQHLLSAALRSLGRTGEGRAAAARALELARATPGFPPQALAQLEDDLRAYGP
ncbi:MAG: tetratricopeptide repeat protein [Candidatus Eiseniibacteriota bacterium]